MSRIWGVEGHGDRANVDLQIGGVILADTFDGFQSSLLNGSRKPVQTTAQDDHLARGEVNMQPSRWGGGLVFLRRIGGMFRIHELRVAEKVISPVIGGRA